MKKKKITQLLDEWASKETDNAPDMAPTHQHYTHVRELRSKPRSFFLTWTFRFAAGGVTAAVLLLFLVFYSDVFQSTQSQISQDMMAERTEKADKKGEMVGDVVGGIRKKGPGISDETETAAPAESPPQAQQEEKREVRMAARMKEPAKAQEAQPIFKFYPEVYPDFPVSMSPYMNENHQEILIAFHESGISLIPVTVGVWDPVDSFYGKFLKGDQLSVDEEDFPTLAETGLHSVEDLEKTTFITGIPVDEINLTARPEQSSYAGFIAHEEDIISVLKNDNELVRKMNLTHPQMARPLFHVWNAILHIMESEGVTRDWRPFEHILYNGHQVKVKPVSTRGFQESIFNDEIRGSFLIKIWRDLSPSEHDFLLKAYSHLSEQEFDDLLERLTKLSIGEMNSYYIMRYGFYEGHTSFRADPISIALIFGLKSLQEIESVFEKDLYSIVAAPYSKESNPDRDN